MRLLYVIPVLALCVYSCGQSASPKAEEQTAERFTHVESAKWLCGTWTNHSEEGLLVESWKQLNDSVLEGKTTFVADGKTQFSEVTRIHQNGDNLIYTATVTAQNDGKPVDFTMTAIGRNYAVFENKAHDFPQKIRYDLKGDSLTAVVSGMEKGVERKEVFSMGKLEVGTP